MYKVLLLGIEIDETDPRKVITVEIELPFPPYHGLQIEFRNNHNWKLFEIKNVMWMHEEQTFKCWDDEAYCKQ